MFGAFRGVFGTTTKGELSNRHPPVISRMIFIRALTLQAFKPYVEIRHNSLSFHECEPSHGAATTAQIEAIHDGLNAAKSWSGAQTLLLIVVQPNLSGAFPSTAFPVSWSVA